jgi:hypothetical protein
MWEESINGTRQLIPTNCTSYEGALKITQASGVLTELKSKAHPRYQPNRGHLYSTSIWLPTPGESGTVREWGLKSDECGIFFRLTDSGLYLVRRRMSTDNETLLTLPSGFDITKGHLYDIQYQWRGVGDYKVFLDQTLVYQTNYLGVLGEGQLPTVCNPSLAVHYSASGNCVLRSGCVDITSEGGGSNHMNYRSISTPINITAISASTATNGVPILALSSPLTFYSKSNTRDAVITRVTAFCKDEAIVAVYLTRDATLFGNITTNANPTLGWAPCGSDTPIKYMYGGDGSLLTTRFNSNFNTSKSRIVVSKRGEIDFPNIWEPAIHDREQCAFGFYPGDYLIVAVSPDGVTRDTGACIEWNDDI